MFQQALLKAHLHFIAIATLIEHARTFLYMTTPRQLQHTLDYMHPFHAFKRVACLPGIEANHTKKKDAHHVHIVHIYQSVNYIL